MISENYQYLIKKFGPITKNIPIDDVSKEEIRKKFPPEFTQFISEFGIGMWLDGRFQFCNPLEFQSIMNIILQGDPDFQPEHTSMFGYSAFGKIMAWNRTQGFLGVSLPRLWASARRPGKIPDVTILSSLMGIGDFNYGDWREDDTDGKTFLFERVRKAHGPLQLGEVYGFFPALELGGRAHVKTARRVKALEHFAILAQLGPATLFDYPNGQQVPIRQLGPQDD
jgi:hypothetical protein